MWPDNGVPSPLDPLVRFVRQVRHEMNRFPTMGPTIIHCSAGVGRTGTFVGIDKLLQDYKNKSYVDIFGMVYEMRMSRCLMVQTEVRSSRLTKIFEKFLKIPKFRWFQSGVKC